MKSMLLCPPRFPPEHGGSQRLFADLAQLWTEDGGRAIVYTTAGDGQDAPPPLCHENLTVRRFPCRDLGQKPWRGRLLAAAARMGSPGWQAALGFPHHVSFSYRRYLRTRAARHDGPFHLMVAGVLPHNHFLAPAVQFARRHHLPWVAVPLLHTGLLARHPLHHVAGPAAADLLATAARVVAMTEAEVPLLCRLGVSRQRIRILPAALMEKSLPSALPAANRTTPVPAGRYYLQAGALAEDKGTLTLLAAHTLRQERGADETLVLAGTPRPEVTKAMAALPHTVQQSVMLIPTPENSEWNGLVQHAECLIQPGRADSFGLVILEAWRAGRPVVVADAGGLPHLVRDQQDGQVVAAGDSQALAQALDRLLTNPDSMAILGDQGRRRFQQEFTWETVYPQWRHLLHQVMNDRNSGPGT